MAVAMKREYDGAVPVSEIEWAAFKGKSRSADEMVEHLSHEADIMVKDQADTFRHFCKTELDLAQLNAYFELRRKHPTFNATPVKRGREGNEWREYPERTGSHRSAVSAWRREANRLAREADVPKCQTCGEPLIGKRKGARFCSDEHRLVAHRGGSVSVAA